MKVVVIGCTHAGTAAVKSILKNHPEAEVTVYERNEQYFFLILRYRTLCRRSSKGPSRLVLLKS